MRLAKTGGIPETMAESPVRLLGLAANAGILLYSDEHDQLFELPLSGGTPKLVQTGVRAFTAVRGDMYWAAKDGLISRRSGDGDVTPITRVDSMVTDLKVRGDWLYIATADNQLRYSSRVVRVAR